MIYHIFPDFILHYLNHLSCTSYSYIYIYNYICIFCRIMELYGPHYRTEQHVEEAPCTLRLPISPIQSNRKLERGQLRQTSQPIRRKLTLKPTSAHLPTDPEILHPPHRIIFCSRGRHYHRCFPDKSGYQKKKGKETDTTIERLEIEAGVYNELLNEMICNELNVKTTKLKSDLIQLKR